MNDTSSPHSHHTPTHAHHATHRHPPVHVELPPAFVALGLCEPLLRAIAEKGFTTPSDIQAQLIPPALTGRDLIGQARTGTGKTAAFGLPILHQITPGVGFQALILTPTRELAGQIEREFVTFAKHMKVKVAAVYGGRRVRGDLDVLSGSPEVIIGTPGRVQDLINRGVLPLDGVRFVVCDEVDRMFDIGFRDEVREILRGATAPHQTIFVSATISSDIERLITKFMQDPLRISTTSAEDVQTVPEAQQFYVYIPKRHKIHAIAELLKHEQPELAIIFCNMKSDVDFVTRRLQQEKINARAIHSDLNQSKRESVLQQFREHKIHLLCATDLASRGLDIPAVSHVINYDLPEDPEVYVHRVGRTARMGATGKAFSFISEAQGQMQLQIEGLINQLLEEYKIPGLHYTRTIHSQSQTHAVKPSDTGEPGTPYATTDSAAKEEVWSPEGFGHVKTENTAALRPISGRYPSRRGRR